MNVFISYSHCAEDEPYFNQFMVQMGILKNQNLITPWIDKNINSGDKWDKEIKEKLNNADIVIFLVSSDFMSSDYIYSTEMKAAIKKHNEGKLKIVPILIRQCDFTIPELNEVQGLPTGLKPVSKWADSDDAWKDVTSGLRAMIKKMNDEQLAPKQKLQGNKLKDNIGNDRQPDAQENGNSNKPTDRENISHGETMVGNYLSQFENLKKRLSDDSQAKDDYFNNQFNSIRGKDKLNAELLGIVTQVRLDDGEVYSYVQKCQVVGALTMSLLDKYDRSKILLLIDFIEDKEPIVWRRALVGLLLGLANRDNEVDDWVEKRLNVFKNDPEFQLAFTEFYFIANFYLDKETKELFDKTGNYNKIPFFDKEGNWFLPFYKESPYVKQHIKKSELAFDICYSNMLGDDCAKYAASIQYNELSKEDRKQFLAELANEQNVISNILKQEKERDDLADKKSLSNYIFILMVLLNKQQKDWRQLLTYAVQSNEIFDYFLAAPFDIKLKAIDDLYAKRTNKAIEEYQNYLGQTPVKDAQALKNLADCYYASYKDEEALKYFQASFDIDPVDAYKNMMIGFILQSSGKVRLEELINYYLNAYALEPTSAWNLARLGYCYQNLAQPDFTKAAEFQLKAQKINPDDFWNNANLGYSLMSLYRYDEALPYHQAAFEEKPDYAWNNRMLGFCYQKISSPDFEKALAMHLKSFEAEPDNNWNTSNIGNCYLALPQPDYGKAMHYFKLVEAKEPLDFLTLENIGFCYEHINPQDFEQALSYYQRVRDIKPEDDWNNLHTAICHYQLGNADEAHKILDVMISKHSSFESEACFISGIVSLSEQKKEEATNYFKAFNKLIPNSFAKAQKSWSYLKITSGEKEELDKIIQEISGNGS